MRFGCCLNMVASGPCGTGIEYIEKLASTGYDYAELPLAEMMAMDEEAFTELCKKVEASGIRCEVCNNFFPKTMRLTGPDADMDAALTYADRALCRAHQLGAEIVVFGSGPAKNVPQGCSLDKGYAQVVRLLKGIDRIATDKNITIVIEPLRSAECNLINSFEQGCRLANDVAGAHIKVLVDYYHLTEEKEPVDHIRKEGKEYLRHVHFANPAGRIYPERMEESDYAAFFEALKDVGYDGRISCEAYTADFQPSAEKALDFLKNNAKTMERRPIIEMRAIKKLFSGVTALEEIEFNLAEGEVHALMGENGAGKSTLAKIISGIYRADGGMMTVLGERCSFSSTREAALHGIAIVSQEFSLLPDFSIAENIFLTDEKHYKKGFILNKKSIAKETSKLLELFHMEEYLDPYRKVCNLSVAQMQIIEILKAVSTKARIIILDEPTASLSEKEVGQLFDIIRRLKQEKVSFIIVSHKINEIYEISDRITVLRDGRLILNGVNTGDLSAEELIKAMVGREVRDLYGIKKSSGAKSWEKKDTVLEVQGVIDQNAYVRDISFQVHQGEIVGFSGLMGAGRTELIRCIFGADPRMKGKVLLHGKEIKGNSIKESIRSRIGFVSEDRKNDGLIQDMSILKNMNLVCLAASSRFILSGKQEEENCYSMIEKLKIKAADIDLPVKSLSGGNQQKVLLAKWMLLSPEVLIVDEPTRGVDIGAKSDIYAILRQLAGQGMAIIVVSSEIPEIMGICDYIYVMREGRITGQLKAEEADEQKIGYYSTIG